MDLRSLGLHLDSRLDFWLCFFMAASSGCLTAVMPKKIPELKKTKRTLVAVTLAVVVLTFFVAVPLISPLFHEKMNWIINYLHHLTFWFIVYRYSLFSHLLHLNCSSVTTHHKLNLNHIPQTLILIVIVVKDFIFGFSFLVMIIWITTSNPTFVIFSINQFVSDVTIFTFTVGNGFSFSRNFGVITIPKDLICITYRRKYYRIEEIIRPITLM